MLSASALTEGQSIPEEAIRLMEKPVISDVIQRSPLILWLGNRMFKKTRKRSIAPPYVLKVLLLLLLAIETRLKALGTTYPIHIKSFLYL